LVAFNQPGALNVLVYFTDGQPTALHLAAIPITSSATSGYCTDKGNRNGVVAYVGGAMGISIAREPNVTSAVPNPDWQRSVDNNDVDTITTNPDNSGCKFAAATTGGSPPVLLQETNRLTAPGNAYLVDSWGNALTGYKSVTLTGSSPNQYVGITTGNIATQIPNIAENALQSAASRYRTLSAANSVNLVTFTVGLGNDGNPPNTDLLEDVANDPGATHYDSDYTSGKMLYATNTDELQSAFARLASEILRITM
jgi:hypothetical protein